MLKVLRRPVVPLPELQFPVFHEEGLIIVARGGRKAEQFLAPLTNCSQNPLRQPITVSRGIVVP